MAKKIALKGGEELDVPEPFIIDDKNLVKVNLEGGDMTEGIWAWVSTEDKKTKYDRHCASEDYGIALTCNQSLIGIPYGCYIPIKYRGSDRPQCDVDWLDLDAEPCMEMSLFFQDKDIKHDE